MRRMLSMLTLVNNADALMDEEDVINAYFGE